MLLPSTTPHCSPSCSKLPDGDEFEGIDGDAPVFNPATLGLRVDDSHQIDNLRDNVYAKVPVSSLVDYLKTITSMVIDGQLESAQFSKRNRKRSVFIDSVGVTTVNFALADEIKQRLVVSGEHAARRKLSEWVSAPS
jgi:hypothetical protein